MLNEISHLGKNLAKFGFEQKASPALLQDSSTTTGQVILEGGCLILEQKFFFTKVSPAITDCWEGRKLGDKSLSSRISALSGTPLPNHLATLYQSHGDQQGKGEWNVPSPMSGTGGAYLVLDAGRSGSCYCAMMQLQTEEDSHSVLVLRCCCPSSLVKLPHAKETSHLVQVHVCWMWKVE